MKDRIEGVGPGRLGSAASQELRKRNFERLSERRLQEAILAITRLSGLSSPYNYRYSKMEASQIIYELDQALQALKEAFSAGLEDLDRMASRRRVVARKLKAGKARK
jgi:hypothetical protein